MAARGTPVLGHPGLVVHGSGVLATDLSRYREIVRERGRVDVDSRVDELQRRVDELQRRVTALEAK